MTRQRHTKELIEKLEKLDACFAEGQISTIEYANCYNEISDSLDKVI